MVYNIEMRLQDAAQNPDDYQRESRKYNAVGWGHGQYHPELSLVEEMGEMFAAIARASIGIEASTVTEKVKENAGDLLWHLMRILDKHQLTFSEVLFENLKKIERRSETGELLVRKDASGVTPRVMLQPTPDFLNYVTETLNTLQMQTSGSLEIPVEKGDL